MGGGRGESGERSEVQDLNNHGTGFLGPNQTHNSFGTQRKLKPVNSRLEFADSPEKHSTNFQHLGCWDRTICGSLFGYFCSKLSRSTDKHDPLRHETALCLSA